MIIFGYKCGYFKGRLSRLFFIPFALILSSCATSTDAKEICKTWSAGEKNGDSTIWNPSEIDKNKLQAALSAERNIECFHILPSRRVIVINWNDKVYKTMFEKQGDNYKILDEEFFP